MSRAPAATYHRGVWTKAWGLGLLVLSACTNVTFDDSTDESKLVLLPSGSIGVERHSEITVIAELVTDRVSAPADSTWTSNDPSIATVEGDGDRAVVTAIAPTISREGAGAALSLRW